MVVRVLMDVGGAVRGMRRTRGSASIGIGIGNRGLSTNVNHSRRDREWASSVFISS
jgi:hypothetical protein